MKNHFKDSELDNPFILHGKPATDSGLYPWALGSLGRSILFYAEAVESKDNKPLEVVSAYYAIFHLFMFTMFASPKLLTPKERKKINKELQGGKRDPSPCIKHENVKKFLEKCQGNELPSEVLELFNELKKAREFINYGPRVYWIRDDIFINTCELSVSKIDNVAKKLKNTFTFTINWLCSVGADDGAWIPILLEQTGKFFNKTNGFYKGWAPENVRKEAESIRAQLYEIAMKKVYKKRSGQNRTK